MNEDPGKTGIGAQPGANAGARPVGGHAPGGAAGGTHAQDGASAAGEAGAAAAHGARADAAHAPDFGAEDGEDTAAGGALSDKQASGAAAPLGDWRAPVLWMSCGAMLAGLVVALVVIIQRVGVERDLAALAGTLPPAVQAPVDETAVPPAPSPPPVAAAPPDEGRAAALAGESAAAGSVAPAAPAVVAPPAVTAAAPQRLERSEAATAPAPPPTTNGSARTGRIAKSDGYQSSRQFRKSETKSAKAATRKPRTYRKPTREHDLYWEVFKRCPLPGEPGAVECRRHVCNGAESEGPACKPYRKRWR